jgi:hypothetical protein
MRTSKQRSRSKPNRPRPVGNIINRVFDSSGPDGKVRGTPQQIIDKYLMLAREAQLSNDRVAAENFLQHAEHYTRQLAEATREMNAEAEARRLVHEAQNRDRQNNNQNNSGQGNNGQNNGQQSAQDNQSDAGQGDRRPREDNRQEDRQRDDRPRDDSRRDDRPRDDRPRENNRRDDRPRDYRQRDDRPRDDSRSDDGAQDVRQQDDVARNDNRRDGQRTEQSLAPDQRSSDMDFDSSESTLVETVETSTVETKASPQRNTRKRAPKPQVAAVEQDAEAAPAAAPRRRNTRKPKPVADTAGESSAPETTIGDQAAE